MAKETSWPSQNRFWNRESSFRGLRGLRGFGDHGEYGNDRGREQDIDNDYLHGFVGCSELFYDFSLITAIIY